MTQYELTQDDALQLAATSALADYFEAAARTAGNARAAANWIMGDLAYALKSSGAEIESSPVAPERLAALIRLIDSGGISGKIAKTVFEEMYRGGEEPEKVVERLGLTQISDSSSLAAAIEKVKASNPQQLAEYRSGKEKLFGYFVGQVMKETRGQANPKLLSELLQKALRE